MPSDPRPQLFRDSRVGGTMAASVQLYAMPISHWCVSADRMLAFKGIPFESLYVAYHDKEELLAATGQDYVPTLMWDDRAVMWYDALRMDKIIFPHGFPPVVRI